MQVFSTSRPELIHPFTGLRPAQFHRLVRLVARRGGDAIADGRPGRPWALALPDRVLLVAVYWRTNLTMRQIGPLFGVSHSAARPQGNAPGADASHTVRRQAARPARPVAAAREGAHRIDAPTLRPAAAAQCAPGHQPGSAATCWSNTCAPRWTHTVLARGVPRRPLQGPGRNGGAARRLRPVRGPDPY
jgi:hypothetical protein